MSAGPRAEAPLDRLQRPLRELRISVTDRCNFRCGYCMPKDVFHDGYRFTAREQLLRFEEIARIARIAVDEFGVEKLRLTGGEPLLRRDLATLVRMLSSIQSDLDLTLTTNGQLLADHAQALVDAGLKRVTVSLDALDAPTLERISGVQGADPERVLAGIEAASRAGLAPIKVNCVVVRRLNEHAVDALARRFRGTGCTVRFIEYMDVGTLNRWDREHVVPADEILALLAAIAPLEPLGSQPSAVAERYRFTDGSGEVGVIASVTRPFCGGCTRARLSADGRFLTCLFAATGRSLRDLARSGATDRELRDAIAAVWGARGDRYSEQRAELSGGARPRRRLEMYQIGG